MTAEEIATVERLAWGEGRIPVPIRQRPREVATFRARRFREGVPVGQRTRKMLILQRK